MTVFQLGTNYFVPSILLKTLKEGQMFEPDFLVFCESKAIGNNGNLSIHEIFDRIYVQSFPASHRPFKLVFRLAAKKAIVNEDFKLKVNLELKGEEMAKLEADLKNLTIEKDNGFVPEIDISNFVFPRAGKYHLNLWLNGKLFFSRPLHVADAAELGEK